MTIPSLATTCLSNRICHHFPVQMLFTQTNFLIPTPWCTPRLSASFSTQTFCSFWNVAPSPLLITLKSLSPKFSPGPFHEPSMTNPDTCPFLCSFQPLILHLHHSTPRLCCLITARVLVLYLESVIDSGEQGPALLLRLHPHPPEGAGPVLSN